MNKKQYQLLVIYLLFAAFLASSGCEDTSVNRTTVSSLSPSDNTTRLQGALNIDGKGQLVYSLPFSIMTTGNGLKPELGLGYSSASNRSYVGWGWNLSGISAIYRCPATKAIDGWIHRPDQSPKDRFCLGGDRLIAVNGVYGKDGTQYRTFHDKYVRVISRGNIGNGPASFEVYRKNDLFEFYGVDQNSRVTGSQAVVTWGISKIQDRHSNTIEFSYLQSPQNKGLLPDKIHYGGNTQANLAHYRHVHFIYNKHPNPTTVYSAGHKLRNEDQLKEVVILSQDKVMWRYVLQNKTPPQQKTQLLAAVKKCFNKEDCSAPITFNYQGENVNPALANPVMVDSERIHKKFWSRKNSALHWSDFNKDGFSDFLAIRNHSSILRYGNTQGLENQTNLTTDDLTNGWITTKHPVRVTDLDRDGFADLVIFYDDKIRIAYGTEGGFTSSNEFDFSYFGTGIKGKKAKNTREVVDCNSDGFPDLVAFNAIQTHVRYGSGDRTNPFGNREELVAYFGSLHLDERYDQRIIQDINGDSYVDILAFISKEVMNDNGEEISGVVVSRGSARGFEKPRVWLKDFHTTTSTGTWRPRQSRKQLADANGDGYLDIIGFERKGVHVALGTGTSFTKPTLWVPYFREYQEGFDYRYHHAFTFDLNQDGLVDFVGVAESTVYVVLNNGGPQTEVNSLTAKLPGIWSLKYSLLDSAEIFSDGHADMIFNLTDGIYRMEVNTPKLRLEKIIDSYKYKIGIEWGLLSDPEVYQGTQAWGYPFESIRGPIAVPKAVTKDNGLGGKHRITYTYQDGVMHWEGFGFIGFKKRIEQDQSTGITQEIEYSQNLNNMTFGLPVNEKRRIKIKTRHPIFFPNRPTTNIPINLEKTLSEIEYKYLSVKNAVGYWQIEPEETIETNYDLLEKEISKKITNKTFSAYGEVLTMDVITKDANGKTLNTTSLVNKYKHNNPQKWLLGKISSAQKTSVGLQDTHVVSSTFEYDPATGKLEKEIYASGTPQERKTQYQFHPSFGSISNKTVTVKDFRRSKGASQVTEFQRDSQGYVEKTIFPTKLHMTQKVNSVTGRVDWDIDRTGLKTTRIYNNRFELETIINPDGTKKEVRDVWCKIGTCPASAIVMQVTYEDGEEKTKIYLDKLNRKVREAKKALDDRWSFVDFTYNSWALLEKQSQPYYSGETIYWKKHKYDVLARLDQVINPDNTASSPSVVDYDYEGLKTTITDAKGHQKIYERNALGQKLSATNHLNETIRFTYNAQGKVATVTDAKGNITKMFYTLAGNRRLIQDPALGDTESDYNGFGFLIGVKDAKRDVHYFYDEGGRKYRSIAKQPGSGQPDITRSWTYDNKGRLEVAMVVGQSKEHYTYDELSRPERKTTTIEGREFVEEITYDKRSRPETHLFPSGLLVRYGYENDILVSLKNEKTDREYWKLDEVNAYGNVKQTTLGNGIVSTYGYKPKTGRLDHITAVSSGASAPIHEMAFDYDKIGNAKLRHNIITKEKETFEYDEINRLHIAKNSKYGNETIEYNELGNIRFRRFAKETREYIYDNTCGLNNNLHAVCMVKTSKPGSSTSHKVEHYTYDTFGQMVSGRNLSYIFNALGKPTRVTGDNRWIKWVYDANQKPVKRTDLLPSGHTTETFYVGSYQLVKRGSSSKHRHTLKGVIIEWKEGQASKHVERYLHSDHLGSVVTVSDQDGKKVARYSYDAWGKKRNPGSVDPYEQQVMTGLTGHQEAADLGIVHMQGRIYDAQLGRFISADPFVQQPDNTSSLNRYAYVWNNPLSNVDPTGYFVQHLFKAIGKAAKWVYQGVKKYWRQILSTAVIVTACIAASYVATPLAYAIVAGGGFTSGYISSRGNLKVACLSAVTAVAFYGVGNAFDYVPKGSKVPYFIAKMHAHGTVGGISSAAQGGNFFRGYAVAGVGQAVSLGGLYEDLGTSDNPRGFFGYFYNAVVAGAIGGTTSKITGGSFEEGAIIAAYGRLFNDTAHMVKRSLLYDGKHLWAVDEKGTKQWKWRAYSGTPGSGPEQQHLKGIGPIPEGDYYVNPTEVDKYNWWDPRDWDWAGSRNRVSWGNYRVPIHKAPDNPTTRGGFFIHGGSIPGSHGCIDLTNQHKSFFNYFERYYKHRTPLRVEYEK